MDSSNLANPMSISEVAGLGPNFAASITAEINSRLDGAFASAGVPTTVPVTEAPVIKTASSGGNLVPGNTVLAAAPKTVEGAAAEAEPTSATAATSAAAEVGPGSSHTEKEPAVSTSQSSRTRAFAADSKPTQDLSTFTSRPSTLTSRPSTRTSSAATITPAPPQPHHGAALAVGFKAAIALGVLVFVLIAAIFGAVWWRRWQRKRRIHDMEAISIRKRRLSRLLAETSLGKAVSSTEKPPEISEKSHPAYRGPRMYEMRAVKTPRVTSKRTSVRDVELSGGWDPAEIDGREKGKKFLEM